MGHPERPGTRVLNLAAPLQELQEPEKNILREVLGIAGLQTECQQITIHVVPGVLVYLRNPVLKAHATV